MRKVQLFESYITEKKKYSFKVEVRDAKKAAKLIKDNPNIRIMTRSKGSDFFYFDKEEFYWEVLWYLEDFGIEAYDKTLEEGSTNEYGDWEDDDTAGEYIYNALRDEAKDMKRSDKKFSKALDDYADRVWQSFPESSPISFQEFKDLLLDPIMRKAAKVIPSWYPEELWKQVVGENLELSEKWSKPEIDEFGYSLEMAFDEFGVGAQALRKLKGKGKDAAAVVASYIDVDAMQRALDWANDNYGSHYEIKSEKSAGSNKIFIIGESAKALEEGRVSVKRKYTEKHPAIKVNSRARVRNEVLKAMADGVITEEELDNIIKTVNGNRNWKKSNLNLFTISEDGWKLNSRALKLLAELDLTTEEELLELQNFDVIIDYIKGGIFQFMRKGQEIFRGNLSLAKKYIDGASKKHNKKAHDVLGYVKRTLIPKSVRLAVENQELAAEFAKIDENNSLKENFGYFAKELAKATRTISTKVIKKNGGSAGKTNKTSVRGFRTASMGSGAWTYIWEKIDWYNTSAYCWLYCDEKTAEAVEKEIEDNLISASISKQDDGKYTLTINFMEYSYIHHKAENDQDQPKKDIKKLEKFEKLCKKWKIKAFM